MEAETDTEWLWLADDEAHRRVFDLDRIRARIKNIHRQPRPIDRGDFTRLRGFRRAAVDVRGPQHEVRDAKIRETKIALVDIPVGGPIPPERGMEIDFPIPALVGVVDRTWRVRSLRLKAVPNIAAVPTPGVAPNAKSGPPVTPVPNT